MYNLQYVHLNIGQYYTKLPYIYNNIQVTFYVETSNKILNNIIKIEAFMKTRFSF